MKQNSFISQIHFLILLTLPLLFASVVTGQSSSSATNWQRMTGDDGFSIAMPLNYQVFSDNNSEDLRIETPILKNGKPVRVERELRISGRRFVTSFVNNNTFSLSSYRVNNGELGANYLSGFCKDVPSTSRFSLNEFSGTQCSVATADAYRITMILSSKERVHVIFAGARDANHIDFRRFLSSIRLGNDAIYQADKDATILNELPFRLLGELKDTPFSVEYSNERSVKASDVVNAQTVTANTKGKIPLKILLKPKASYTLKARMNAVGGTIIMRIAFSADGSISRISIINNGLTDGLNEEAIRAARQIRFLPQIEEGIPVTIERFVEYKFTIY